MVAAVREESLRVLIICESLSYNNHLNVKICSSNNDGKNVMLVTVVV